MKQGKWVIENRNDIVMDSPIFVEFLDKLKIMNNSFTNFEDITRKYSKVVVLIERFLRVNKLNDIDAKLLMDHWKGICFDNATHSKLRVEKKDFLRSIYTIHVVTDSNNTEMTRSKFLYISSLFQDVLNSGILGQEFENKIMTDALMFFNLAEIDQFQYKQSKVDEFIEEKYEEYKSFFLMDDLRDQQIIDLTKYALQNWLENIELINYLDSEEIKGVG
ncbi:hypothetical protein KAR53_06590 [Periweissella ghanensis]|uniref:Uncharacterized protein n=1 Tax=Periweissella ghanensis TaxID=467997 RepID=A0ABM8Z995_9LACO|nr:hypothetical protein [Periweissella ghanensis]MCM0601243.1 hypothetical protein [Periweissella ghanensis]CAH0418043.1 hypothetical protein WGH24286_00459 [Periweissella ghanensis]